MYTKMNPINPTRTPYLDGDVHSPYDNLQNAKGFREKDDLYAGKILLSNHEKEKEAERKQIEAVIMTLDSARNNTMSDYLEFVRQKAFGAKSTIDTQKNQLDSAIKGQIEKKIKQVVSEKIAAYDKIV